MNDAIMIISVTLGVCVVLPLLIVWLVMRYKTNRDNRQAEIILTALEKNPNLDVEEFMKKLAPQKKTEAEKLNDLLRNGLTLAFMSVAFLGLAIWTFIYGASRQAVGPFAFVFLFCLGVGAANLIAYSVRKKNTQE